MVWEIYSGKSQLAQAIALSEVSLANSSKALKTLEKHMKALLWLWTSALHLAMAFKSGAVWGDLFNPLLFVPLQTR